MYITVEARHDILLRCISFHSCPHAHAQPLRSGSRLPKWFETISWSSGCLAASDKN